MSKYTVYTLKDVAGLPIYVGVTDNLTRRTRQHRASKPWAAEIATIETEGPFPRDAAYARERQQIAALSPRYNGNPVGGSSSYPRTRRNALEESTRPSITKSFNLPTPIATAIEDEAKRQGHNNQSTIALKAFTDYLNRRNDPRVA